MKLIRITALVFVAILSSSVLSLAQYNTCASQNTIFDEVEEEVVINGKKEVRKRKVEVAADSYGNAAGNQYDLAVDGAFEGQTVAVLHFYTGEGFDFHLPEAALKEKGFGVYRWLNQAPSPKELKKALGKSCQLWIISDATQKLNNEHAEIIKEFFDSGKGVYIWGDNQPYYSDANFIAQKLFGASMTGNLMGNQTVGILDQNKQAGIVAGHLISTGIQQVYEGITIATINDNSNINPGAAKLSPLIYGSAGNLVAAIYEQDGKRAVIDGGFTRLFINWDTAGTARYVKNSAAWLVNYERFGNDVVAN